MGGNGSGRHFYLGRRTTVEECRHIDANRWTQEKILAPDQWTRGRWYWRDADTGEEHASVGYQVDTRDSADLFVRLFYTIGSEENRQSYNYRVTLVMSSTPWGKGYRWWFVCPLAKGNTPCGRRVAKLYLAPGSRYFGCRHCHDLTYQSSQESHKWDGVYMMVARSTGMPVEVVREVMQGWEEPKKKRRRRYRM